MVTIRSVNTLIQSLTDFLKIQQPDLDTKPGTVARDLFVECPASQLSLLYDELSKISNLQSLRLTTGQNLDYLAQNFGGQRKSAVASSGVALITFPSIPAPIAINRNSLVYASNGVSFTAQVGMQVSPNFLSQYRAIAQRYQANLQFLGITDQYAVEVPVLASVPGTIGNISQYGLNRVSIPGANNVTNVTPFLGGADQEDDDTFRNRILAIFSGSNVGTSLGYRNAVLTDVDVIDALVITPGDPLMTRDGTVVSENADGSFTILSEGSGGKVDIIVLGTRLQNYTDSFIYHDKSNQGDPTSQSNIIVLGQIAADVNKTVTRKRIDNLAAGTLPAQPVDTVTQVTGSLSGSNFKPAVTDTLGRTTGNYEIIKDTGVYAGSPWGFDKFHWIDNKITDYPEDLIKGKVNGQDSVTFSDVLNISQAQQNVSISNENSILVSGTNRSTVQVLHTPCQNVTRVFNLTTGERYTVIDQNPNGTGTINTTGQIKIAGNTLPSPSDTLQVDYTWIVSFDPYMDYDGRFLKNNPRTVNDSIDWGISNAVRGERVTFTKNGAGTFYTAAVNHPISAMISTNLYTLYASTATLVTSGIFSGKISATISGVLNPLTGIDSAVLQYTQTEIYNTAQNDGTIVNQKVVVGAAVQYVVTVIFPSDSTVQAGNDVEMSYGKQDVFTPASGQSGNFNLNTITIPVANVSGAPTTFDAQVNYIANVQNLLSVKLSDLPLTRKGNGYQRNSFSVPKFANQSFAVSKEFSTVVMSGGTGTVKLNCLASEFTVDVNSVISVIRLSDNAILWSPMFKGTVVTAGDGSIQLNLQGINSPANGDNVLVIYSSKDLTRTQPVTFSTKMVGFLNLSVHINATTGLAELTSVPFPSNFTPSHVSIIRISDGQELSDDTTAFDLAAHTLTFPAFSQPMLHGGEYVACIFFNNQNWRDSSTRLGVTLSDQINNEGMLKVSGTTITKANQIVMTSINDGLKLDISEAFRTALGLTSVDQLSPDVSCGRVVAVEKVTMIGSEVISIDAEYDCDGTEVRDYYFFTNEMNEDLSLSNVQLRLPATVKNLANPPALGDKLRVTFYILNSNDSESISFTRNGQVYGNKSFGTIDQIAVESGFSNSTTGKITIAPFNQPDAGSRYAVKYNYTAPKTNERILINYNYNALIDDATIALEPNRPISADVLIKQATKLLMNVGIAIVVKSNFSNSSAVVVQNVKDKIISSINNNKLGASINSSDLVTVAKSVDGVDRVRVTGFNVDQRPGLVLTVTAQKNQYFVANQITVVSESIQTS